MDEISKVSQEEQWLSDKLKEAYVANDELKSQIGLIHATLFGLVVGIEKSWGIRPGDNE